MNKIVYIKYKNNYIKNYWYIKIIYSKLSDYNKINALILLHKYIQFKNLKIRDVIYALKKYNVRLVYNNKNDKNDKYNYTLYNKYDMLECIFNLICELNYKMAYLFIENIRFVNILSASHSILLLNCNPFFKYNRYKKIIYNLINKTKLYYLCQKRIFDVNSITITKQYILLDYF